jgi:hypothetical protein
VYCPARKGSAVARSGSGRGGQTHEDDEIEVAARAVEAVARAAEDAHRVSGAKRVGDRVLDLAYDALAERADVLVDDCILVGRAYGKDKSRTEESHGVRKSQIAAKSTTSAHRPPR